MRATPCLPPPRQSTLNDAPRCRFRNRAALRLSRTVVFRLPALVSFTRLRAIVRNFAFFDLRATVRSFTVTERPLLIVTYSLRLRTSRLRVVRRTVTESPPTLDPPPAAGVFERLHWLVAAFASTIP